MIFFFFSSRRRHTRLQGDWSSDVCSSDLLQGHARPQRRLLEDQREGPPGERRAAPPGLPAVLEVGRELEQGERPRSEEHTSELQSPCNLVCRLLLEKKN